MLWGWIVIPLAAGIFWFVREPDPGFKIAYSPGDAATGAGRGWVITEADPDVLSVYRVTFNGQVDAALPIDPAKEIYSPYRHAVLLGRGESFTCAPAPPEVRFIDIETDRGKYHYSPEKGLMRTWP